MINAQTEELVVLKELPKRLPRRDGKQINLSTIYRWKNKGLYGVRLETCYHAGIQHTSLEAVGRFDEAVTIAKNGPYIGPPTSVQKQKAKEEAMRELGLA